MKSARRIARTLGLGLAITGATGCSSCFVRGTKVATPKGLRAIEDLAVGDEVWSYSLADRAHVVRRVAAVLRARATETLAVGAGEFAIEGVTAEHPFWDVAFANWRTAASLSLESVLLVAIGGGEVRHERVREVKRLPARGEVEVFNLTIAGDEQNYFANGVLVHNKSRVCDEACQVPVDVVRDAGDETVDTGAPTDATDASVDTDPRVDSSSD